ncbi:unnamed protein product [Paramecium pentaurelia]|uniref:Transmembrane protein n=1 Tax=Paramecium pentaurelia TaxID=43138 RepID=A0A8S1UZ19_9CILI|nr:unnamed protein product [Paramecium pentaurelia]
MQQQKREKTITFSDGQQQKQEENQYQPVKGQHSEGQYQNNPQSQKIIPFSAYAQYAQYPQKLKNASLYKTDQPMHPIDSKKMDLRSLKRLCYSEFLYGGRAERIACIMFIISLVVFTFGNCISICSKKRFLYYQVIMGISLIFEISGSIIIFASFNYVDQNLYYQEDEQKYPKEVGLIYYIISFILIMITDGILIYCLRKIRFKQLDLIISKGTTEIQTDVYEQIKLLEMIQDAPQI